MKNVENALSVPLIRKDITGLSSQLGQIKDTLDRQILALQVDLTTQTGRVYDLGKWFVGILLVACILPLIEPLFKHRGKAGDMDAPSEAAHSKPVDKRGE